MASRGREHSSCGNSTNRSASTVEFELRINTESISSIFKDSHQPEHIDESAGGCSESSESSPRRGAFVKVEPLPWLRVRLESSPGLRRLTPSPPQTQEEAEGFLLPLGASAGLGAPGMAPRGLLLFSLLLLPLLALAQPAAPYIPIAEVRLFLMSLNHLISHSLLCY